MDLALKRPWAGLLFFFWVGMVLSETGEPYGPQLKIHRKAIERIIQKSMTEGNILDEMSSMATKNKGGAQAIKGMKAMKVKEITPPEICTKLIPHNQMQTSVITSITVAGKSNVGGKMEITLKAKMNIMIKMSKHPTKHIGMEKMGCEVQVLAWTTNLPSRMIPKVVNKFLNTTLGKVMPGMMCPAADKVITFMETKVEAMFEKKSFGKNGTLWYEVVEEPAVFPDYNFIHLKIKLQKANGEIIGLPSGPLPDDLPPKEEGKSTVYVPVSIINAIMRLLRDTFKFAITEIKGSILTTDQLNKICPEAGLPAGKQVKVVVTQNDNLRCTVLPAASNLTLPCRAAFFLRGDSTEVLHINMVQECTVKFDIKNEQLRIIVEPGSCRTIEITSPAVNVELANEHMKSLMDECVPQLNDVLSENQLPLPSLLGVMYAEGETTLVLAENLLVFNVMIEAYNEREMMEQVRQHQKKTKAMSKGKARRALR